MESQTAGVPARPDTHGIRIQAVSKQFGEFLAVDSVSLSIPKGEFLCIVGPSGCGKTTVLKMLAGLEQPSSGQIVYALRNEGRPMQSMVFQGDGIFPWMTALENAAFGLRVRDVPRRERHAIAQKFLDKLGIGAFAGSYPAQLSGGMRQRVNIARAFANDPEVLLMDEPMGALDEQTKMLVQEDLLALWEENHKTVVFITHSLDEAVVLADRVVVMSARPGRIKGVYPVPLDRPRDGLELRNSPDFIEIRAAIWESLRAEVLATHDAHRRARRSH